MYNLLEIKETAISIAAMEIDTMADCLLKVTGKLPINGLKLILL